MRDIVVSLIILSSLPYAFRRPFYGLVIFTWLAYMRAPDLCWGFARGQRWSLYVAMLMFAGFFLFERKRFFVPEIRNYLLILLTFFVLLSVLVNYIQTDMAFGAYEEFVKIILITMFTVTIVNTRWKLRVMIWTIALSLGFYGIKGGLFGFMGGQILRGPGGLLLDNNDFSLAMVMNIPFLYFLSIEEKKKNVKLFFKCATFLTLVTIVATHSRGGFLALVVVYFVLTMKSKYKLVGFGLAFVGVILFIIFIPAEYVERLRSITDTKEASAASRLVSWKTAIIMIKANPFFGVGMGNFFHNYFAYCPVFSKYAHVAHNSYLQVWAECGSFAFITYMSIIGITLWRLRRVNKWNRRRRGPTWVSNYCNIFEVTLIGFLVGSTFLNRGQFDLVYQIIGLSITLGILARKPSEVEDTDGPPILKIRSRDGYVRTKKGKLGGNIIS